MRSSRYALILLGLVLAGGCVDNPTDPAENTPIVPSIRLQNSVDTSSDARLIPLLGRLNDFNSFFNPVSPFKVVRPKRNGSTWTWTSSSDSLTEVLTAVKRLDGGFDWKRVLNGVKGGKTFTNWIGSQGATNANGSSGTWTMQTAPGDSGASMVDWSTDSTEAVLTALKFLQGSRVLTKHVTTARPDLSGWLRNFSDSVTTADKWVWQSSGHGNYFTFSSPIDSLLAFSW